MKLTMLAAAMALAATTAGAVTVTPSETRSVDDSPVEDVFADTRPIVIGAPVDLDTLAPGARVFDRGLFDIDLVDEDTLLFSFGSIGNPNFGGALDGFGPALQLLDLRSTLAGTGFELLVQADAGSLGFFVQRSDPNVAGSVTGGGFEVDFSLTAVPLPASWLFLIVAIGGLGLIQRRARPL